MRVKRFIIDSDGTNLLLELTDNVQQDVAEAVRELPDEVTTVMVCANAGCCFWPTQIGTRLSQRAPALARAYENGIDPLRLWLDNLKAAGKETLITCRMNDVHNPTETWNTPAFRRDNPECIVGLHEVKENKAQWDSYCMDYTLPAVRQYMLDLISEQLALYGDVIDGFQLDWMRFPRHLSGNRQEVREKHGILTEFTAQVRKLLNDTDRKILLVARVPTQPQASLDLGMNVQQWVKDRNIDALVVCPFLTTDWQIPIADWRTVIGSKDVPVYAGFDLAYGEQLHYPESMRGICSSLYEDGADGLYLFNFPCWIERLSARPYHWLEGLDDPTAAAAKPMTLSVNHKRSRNACDPPWVIPTPIPPGSSLALKVRIPAAACPFWRARIHLEARGGSVNLNVTGRPLAELLPGYRSGSCRSETFVEFVNHYRPVPLRADPAQCQQFRLDIQQLQAGDNEFILTNAGPQPVSIHRFNLNLW